MEEILKADTEAALRRTERLMEVGDQLLCKVEQVTEVTDSPAGLKTLTEALKNIRDAQMLKENRSAEGDRITVVLEEVAFMDWHAMVINPDQGRMQQSLLDKHYLRKHGKNAYYGQK